jgi:hypothetical protein
MTAAKRITGILVCACALLAVLAPAAAALLPPVATTGSAGNITATSATLHGTVNPEGEATTYHFEYGTTVAYGSQTDTASAGSGSTNVTASGTATPLTPDTTYHYRLVATNASGTTPGTDHTFKTAKAPVPKKPVVVTGDARNVNQTSATLTGTVNPNGQATSYFFQYGTTTGYGGQTPTISAGAGSANVGAAAAIGSLAPNTTYHFRLVASYAAGSVAGRDRTFKTDPAPSGITLVASPSTVTLGQVTNFTGTVGAPRPPFVTVVLQTATGPNGPWADYQITAADKGGTFSFPQIGPTSDTWYRATAAGGASPAVLVVVLTPGGLPIGAAPIHFHVGLRVSRSHPRRGHFVRFHGRVTPGHPGLLVYLQRLGHGRWHTIKRMRLRGASAGAASYSFRVRIRRSGRWRVVVPDERNHPIGISRTVRIRVRR